MIPYDDLVAALSAWRARQGLPVSTMGGSSSPAPKSGSGPYAQPGSGGARAAPPPPPAGLEEPLDVDDAEMVEEQYEEAAGPDYAMTFGNTDDQAPDRPTEPNDFGGGKRGGGGRGDW